jgi:hypothetical protein
MAETPAESAEDRALDALISVIQTASGPGVAEAQALLLRRLALDGDVIPSRLPAPKNITEVGGYLNMLETVGQRRAIPDVLAGALGIASASARSFAGTAPPLTYTTVENDRPAGAAAVTAPTNVLVRADLATGIIAAKTALHAFGAVLPLWAPPVPPTLLGSSDPLTVLGRRLHVLPTAALSAPATDSIVVARDHDGLPALAVMARPDAAAAPTAALADVDAEAVAFDAATGAPVTVQLGLVKLVGVAPLLAANGWLSSVAAAPASRSDLAWAQLSCVAGLVPGVTRLRDELELLYPAESIADSSFAQRVDQVWNGTEFVDGGA